MSLTNNKRNKKKKKVSQLIPRTRFIRLQNFKSSYKPGMNEPTLDSFLDLQSSSEYDYDLPDEKFEYDRPSERGFSFEGFWKPVLIAVIATLIVGYGTLILIHESKIAIIEHDNKSNEKNINENKEDIKVLYRETESIKSEQKLHKYRIDELDKDK